VVEVKLSMSATMASNDLAIWRWRRPMAKFGASDLIAHDHELFRNAHFAGWNVQI
jgi:hypothetical protein